MDTANGVLLGLAASAVSAIGAFWWKGTRDLRNAAAHCYGRLLKLRDAQTRPASDDKATTLNNETHNLGIHMDLYVASIGSVVRRRLRRRYWDAYESMVPILIGKDFRRLDVAITRLAPLVKATRRSTSRRVAAETSPEGQTSPPK